MMPSMAMYTREASVASATPRTPGDLAALVPEGVDCVLDATSADPTLWPLLRQRGVRKIITLKESLETYAAQTGSTRATVVISDGILPRCRNPAPYLEAAYQILTPGGLLILVTPNMQYHASLSTLTGAGWRYEAGTAWDREHLRFFTPVELKRLLSAQGFEPLRTVPVRLDPPEAFPLDTKGFAQTGNVCIGPMGAAEHQSLLAADIACLALRPAWQTLPGV